MLSGGNTCLRYGNIHWDLIARMNGRSQGQRIHMLRLFSDGGYYIADDAGHAWDRVGFACHQALMDIDHSGDHVEEIAVAYSRAWAVLRSDSYAASSDVDNDLKQHLNRFYTEHRQRQLIRAAEIDDYQRRVHMNRGF